jgi:hypothetical protein
MGGWSELARPWANSDHPPLKIKYGPSRWKTIAYGLPTTRAIIHLTFKPKKNISKSLRAILKFLSAGDVDLPHCTVQNVGKKYRKKGTELSARDSGQTM